MNFLYFYYKQTGSLVVGQIEYVPSSRILQYKTIREHKPGAFSTGWTHIDRLGGGINAGPTYLWYNSRTGAGGYGQFHIDGNHTTIREYNAGAFSLGWTHVKGGFFYNAQNGMAAIGKLNTNGDYVSVREYGPGAFSPGWTHITGVSVNFTTGNLIDIKQYVLYYNARTGNGAVGQFDRDFNHTTMREYGAGAFSPGWTHIITNGVDPADSLLYYNANTGAGAMAKLDKALNHTTTQSFAPGAFATGWTDIVNFVPLRLFFKAETGACAVMDIRSNTTVQEFQARVFPSGWSHVFMGEFEQLR